MLQKPFRLAALVTLGVLVSACATLKDQIKEPQVAVQQVKLRNVALDSMQLDFILGVENPNPLGISVQGMSYKLALDNRSMFDGTTQERLSVPAQGSSQLTLPFTLDYEELLGSLDALRNKKTVAYELSGKVNLGLIALPYSKRGEITLPSLPDIRVSSLRVSRFDLTGVGLVLGLSVANNNEFPLHLSGLAGDIKLGGVSLVQGRSLGAMNIAAGKQDEVQLSLNMAYSKLGNVLDALRKAQSLPVSFDGAIQVPALQGERSVPMHWSGNVPISR